MSLVSNALAAALSAVSTARGEALAYRATISEGEWTTLTGFVLDRDEIPPPAFSDQQQAEETIRGGRLSGPLTPVLAVGYELQDGNGDTWAIETAELDQQQLCNVRLTTIANAGPDRGGAA